MIRFLPLLILTGFVFGQVPKPNFLYFLPELTKFPKNKFVIIRTYSFEENFGEIVEKLDEDKYAYLFDNKGRINKRWDYDPELYTKFLSLIMPSGSIDTSKIREYSDPNGFIELKTFSYNEETNEQAVFQDGIIINTKFDEKGFPSLRDAYNIEGDLLVKEKSKWLDNNNLKRDVYSSNGELASTTLSYYEKGMLTSQDIDTKTYMYNYTWVNDTKLFVVIGSEEDISNYEIVFDDEGLLLSWKKNEIVQVFGDTIQKPVEKRVFNYYESKDAYDDYENEFKSKGTLSLKSDPSEMNVWIDGKKTNYVTPVVIEGLTSRIHYITLENEKYYDSERILIASDDTTYKKIKLSSKTAKIKIESYPTSASVYVGTHYIGLTPITAENIHLDWEYDVKILKKGYETHIEKILSGGAKTYFIDITLTK